MLSVLLASVTTWEHHFVMMVLGMMMMMMILMMMILMMLAAISVYADRKVLSVLVWYFLSLHSSLRRIEHFRAAYVHTTCYHFDMKFKPHFYLFLCNFQCVVCYQHEFVRMFHQHTGLMQNQNMTNWCLYWWLEIKICSHTTVDKIFVFVIVVNT